MCTSSVYVHEIRCHKQKQGEKGRWSVHSFNQKVIKVEGAVGSILGVYGTLSPFSMSDIGKI